jgi:protease-4
MSANKDISETVKKKKNNLGCFGVGAIGCGLFILLIGIVVGLIVLFFSSDTKIWSTSETVIKEGSESKIAVVRIDGLIAEGDSVYDYTSGYSSASSEGIINQLELAVVDENVEAILLRMNTPGGEIVATDLIYQKVVELDSHKPIVTWMSGMGASGGYYIACGTRYIIAHSETITGSIGVIMEISSLEGLYEMLGIETRTFKSGKYKDDEGLYDSDDEGEADQIMQELVDDSYENFYNIVKEEREFTDEQMSEFADGRVVSGSNAFELGMVDEVGTYDDAIGVIEDIVGIEDMSIIEYDYGGFWDSLYGYSNSILDKFGLSGSNLELGAKMYYVVDL